MRELGRTLLEISAIAATIAAALVFCVWLTRAYLGFSREVVAAIVAATTILVVPTAIYGYYTGWIKRRVGGTPEELARLRAFSRRFRLVIFWSLTGLPVLLALLSFFVARNATVATLCLIIAALVAPWSLHKIRRESRAVRAAQERETPRYPAP